VATLTDYLNETRRYLHDANATYWSDADLTFFINKAMQQRDRDTGQNRALVTFPLVVGQIDYPLALVSSSAFDVAGIVVVYANVRCVLQQTDYTDLSGRFLTVSGYNQLPAAFCKYGAGVIKVGPAPNQIYSTEWDCLVTSTALVNPTDADPLPYPWTDPVPFKACEFAKQELGEYDLAGQYRQQYAQRLQEVQGGARGMSIANYYSQWQG
jgi:hypothetical protein